MVTAIEHPDGGRKAEHPVNRGNLLPLTAIERQVRANIEIAFLSDDDALLIVGWIFDPAGLVTGLAIIDKDDTFSHEWSIHGHGTAGDGGERVACRRVMRPDVTQAMVAIDRSRHDAHGIVFVVQRCPSAGHLALVLGDGRIAAMPVHVATHADDLKRMLSGFAPALASVVRETVRKVAPEGSSLRTVLEEGVRERRAEVPAGSRGPAARAADMVVERFADMPSAIDNPDILVAAIDRSFPLGEAGVLILGWQLFPAMRPVSICACSEQGHVVEISGLQFPMSRPDVVENQRRRFPDVGESSGFVCLVPLPTRAGEPRALRFNFGDLGSRWIGIPTDPIDQERAQLLQETLALLPPDHGPQPADEAALRKEAPLAWADLPQSVKFPLRVRFADSAEFVYETVAAGLDPAAYAAAHPDVSNSACDPVTHYLLYGADEGRNPTADFDTEFYLRSNEDVRTARVNPFFHYLLQGRSEGRSPLPPATEPPPADAAGWLAAVADAPPVDFASWKSIVAEVFSPEFYLQRYPDVVSAGIDPFEHYFWAGWKEGRQPAWDFDPGDYLERYPDVANARLEPLFHYLATGRAEGRLPQGELFDQFQQLKAAPVQRGLAVTATNAAAMEAVSVTDAGVLRDSIAEIVARRSPKGIVVGVSHDNVLETIGGIQNCVNDEQRTLTTAGWMYVHLYPAVASPNIFSEKHRDYPVGINIDGRPVGVTAGRGIDTLFDGISAGAGMPMTCVLHSLLGHSVEPVIRLARRHKARTYLWVHDYGLLCSNFLLTRNELEYCAAPPAGSATCGICSFGASRETRIRLVRHLIDQVPLTVVAPSRFAADLFAAKIRTRRGRLAGKIVRHTMFVQMPTAAEVDPQADGPVGDRPLRIAYLGYEAFHKGWAAWKQLLRKVDRSRGVEFLHLGKRQTVIDFVRHRDVAVTGDHRDAMVDAVREERIDYAFIWPNWPETYSYVACEAIAGGARILTNGHSGNIADLARDGDRGAIYGTLDELIAELNAGQPALRAALMGRPRQSFRLEYNPGCAREIMAAEAKP
jgi:hypothetical protein